MKKKILLLDQLDTKLSVFHGSENQIVPSRGWIYSLRQALNMSLRQLGERLKITPQSVKEIEEREENGTISIKVLRQVAEALDMHFVYGFVPKDGSLKNMVDKKAHLLAKHIVERTSLHMSLEDQENTRERIENAIKEKAEEYVREMPKMLWD